MNHALLVIILIGLLVLTVVSAIFVDVIFPTSSRVEQFAQEQLRAENSVPSLPEGVGE
jgi:lipopolysaccharide export LptBFGC system permease protein LptF